MDTFSQDHRFLANGMKPNGGHEGNCVVCPTPDDATWNNITMEECFEFNTNCQCRAVGETCYSDFGFWYDVLMISLFLVHAYIFYLSVPLAKECWTNYKTPGKNGKAKKLNPMDKCLLITCGCQFMRLLFIITIANGRHTSVLIGPGWVSAMLLKIYQVQEKRNSSSWIDKR